MSNLLIKEKTSLSSSAQCVQKALSEKGMNFKVVELPSSTRTAVEAAQTIGCDVAQIVKSLIFRTKESKQPILVLASGVNRVNEKAIFSHIGELLERADADFTRDVTGFAIGGIPPVGHKAKIKTFIDEDLLKLGTLWAAAGTPNAVFSLDSQKIADLTGGVVISII